MRTNYDGLNEEITKTNITDAEKEMENDNNAISFQRKYYTWERDGRVEFRESFGVAEKPVTIPQILKEAADKYASKFALGFMEKGQRKYVTFAEYFDRVKIVAKAFLRLGLQRYHSVCIIGLNSPEWFYSNLGAIMAGGFACGVYTSNSADACLHCLRISEANIVVVENDFQLQKILSIKDQASQLKAIVQINGKPTHDSVICWEELMMIGSQVSEEALIKITENLLPNECSTLLFTSGTTGSPKAVMLSHDNLIFKAKITEKNLQMNIDNRRILSYLPLSHVAAQIFDLYKGLISGACIYFADDRALRDTIIENLRAVRPTEFLGVPRIWEKIKECIDNYMMNTLTLSQHSYKISDDHLLNRRDDETLCVKIKDMVGLNECKIYQSGAAPISSDLKAYFFRLNMPLGEAFGLTETSGGFISTSKIRSDRPSFDCGKPIPGVHVKIHQPDKRNIGEICVKGRPIFMGYLKNPDSTRAAFDDEGYFHTGDLGYCDRDSSYRITGRIKELLITLGGENVSPALIELEVKNELPIVSHAVLVGDEKKFLSLLITLKSNKNAETGAPTDELPSDLIYWYKSVGCDCKRISEIIDNRPFEVFQAIQDGIYRANTKAISSAQRIKKFTILPNDFSQATGELSPTSKLLRYVIYEKYRAEIDAMYCQ